MKNNMNFDKTRYFELLQNEEYLKKEEEMELLSYSIILENQIYYNSKEKYTLLVEEYLRENAGEEGARLFVWEFFIIFKKDNKTLEILEKEILQNGIQRLNTFQINPKSTEFSALVNEMAGDCEFLTFDPKDTYGITLDQFRGSIQKIYLKMQNNNKV